MESETYPLLLTIIQISGQEVILSRELIFLCVIILLLLLSAIFAGFEKASLSLTSEQRSALETLNSRGSAKVLRLLSDPEKLITTVIVSTYILNFLNILLFVMFLNRFPAFSVATPSGILLQILVIFSSILIFSKYIPVVLASRKPIGFSLFAVSQVTFAGLLFYPIIYALMRFNKLIRKSFLINHNNLSFDQLSEVLDKSENVISEDRQILRGIVNFSNIEVSDVMRPRMDVVSVDIDTLFPDLIKVINDSGYSRIPVFSETFDNIKGILYVKDLLPFIGEKESFRWQDLIRPGYYVPETKKIKDLLQEFLDKKIHLAIVVDEYGGTEGIVTLEDVLEEIVGEITDESDEVESFYSRIDDYNYIFDGKILLNDFFKIVQLPEDLFEPDRGDADTLAGLILEIKGEIPATNEIIQLKNFSFTILAVDERRIKKLKFTIDKNFKNR